MSFLQKQRGAIDHVFNQCLWLKLSGITLTPIDHPVILTSFVDWVEHIWKVNYAIIKCSLLLLRKF